MQERSGFFQLQSPLDLLNKMDHDYLRLSNNPIDTYAAFDFFVAADHLPEWLGKAKCNPGEEQRDRYGRALRNICRQLSTGAKHFENSDYDAIVGTSVISAAVYGEAVFGESLYDDTTGNLILALADDEAEAIGQRVISAVALAGMVLTYWKHHDAVLRAAVVLGFPNDIP